MTTPLNRDQFRSDITFAFLRGMERAGLLNVDAVDEAEVLAEIWEVIDQKLPQEKPSPSVSDLHDVAQIAGEASAIFKALIQLEEGTDTGEVAQAGYRITEQLNDMLDEMIDTLQRQK